MYYKSLRISLRPLQNGKVPKWPNFASSGERERRRLIFEVSIFNQMLCSILSFEIPLTVKNKPNDLKVSRDSSIGKMKVHFLTDVVHSVTVVVS